MCCAFAVTSSAAPVTYDVAATFDGHESWPFQTGTLSGTFDFEPTTGGYSNVDLFTTPGVTNYGAPVYGRGFTEALGTGDPGFDSVFIKILPADLALGIGPTGPIPPFEFIVALKIWWSSPLDGISTVSADVWEVVCSLGDDCRSGGGIRTSWSGTATPRTPSVPEPTTLLLVAGGLLVLIFRRPKESGQIH